MSASSRLVVDINSIGGMSILWNVNFGAADMRTLKISSGGAAPACLLDVRLYSDLRNDFIR